MGAGFEYAFPAIRGIQARREYYVSMCPLRLLPRLFLFDEDDSVPELRAQRQLNKARVPDLSRYITENLDNYVFSAITVSVDAEVTFEKLTTVEADPKIGILRIPMSARFIINDGQHRRAAIDLALREKPELGDETIAVVFFLDLGLARCQQMFADLNRYAIRPSKSLGILYDYRDETAMLTKELIARSVVFRDLVELEKTNLAPRSKKLFTLSALYHATQDLVDTDNMSNPETAAQLALLFWEETAKHMTEWRRVKDGELTAGEVRTSYIHTHGVVLQALARAGHALIQRFPKQWAKKLDSLEQIDWRRTNGSLWEGRTMIGGQVSKTHHSTILTANVIKTTLGLELTADEQKVEQAHRGGNGSKRH
jgi:DNA sulfur modification protein DndB